MAKEHVQMDEGNTLQLYTCMHMSGLLLCVCACMHFHVTCACMLVACDYKLRFHAEKSSLFLNKQMNKMSTEKKDLVYSQQI